MKKNRTIPTLVGVFFLTGALVAGIILISSARTFKSEASQEAAPKDLRVTNIAANSFSVSWITDVPTRGFVKYGESQTTLSETALDDIEGPATTHFVTLAGLAPNKTYFFKINSSGADFDSNGIPWSAETSADIGRPEFPIMISGRVEDLNGQPAADAIVYAQIELSTPVASITTADGNWLITLSQALTTPSLTSYTQIDINSTVVDIYVQAGAEVASAKIRVKAANPTPTITLGQVHDFTNLEGTAPGEVPEASLDLPPEEISSSRFTVQEATVSANVQTVTLESHEEGEVITTTTPEFFGEGPAGTALTITIESEPITKILTVPSSGDWKFPVPTDLSVGVHKITISWRDAAGILRTLTRSFVVQAAEGPAFESTPSATLTPTPTSTSTPVSTPTPTIAATSTPSVVPIPDSGTLTPTLIMLILGIGLIVVSLAVTFII